MYLDLNQIKAKTNFSKTVQEAIYFISILHKEQNDNIENNFKTLKNYCNGGLNGFFNTSIFSDKFKINEPLTWRYQVNNKYVFVAGYFIERGIRGEIKINESSNNYDITVSRRSSNNWCNIIIFSILIRIMRKWLTIMTCGYFFVKYSRMVQLQWIWEEYLALVVNLW